LSGMAGVFAFARSAGTWSRRTSLGSDSEVRENRREILRLRLRPRKPRERQRRAQLRSLPSSGQAGWRREALVAPASSRRICLLGPRRKNAAAMPFELPSCVRAGRASRRYKRGSADGKYHAKFAAGVAVLRPYENRRPGMLRGGEQ